MKLCDSETTSGNRVNAALSASSGHAPTNGGRSGGGGGLKLGIVRLGRAAGKVRLMMQPRYLNDSITHTQRVEIKCHL